jgi:hypothetical protein
LVSVRIDAPAPREPDPPRSEPAVPEIDRPRLNQPIGEVVDVNPPPETSTPATAPEPKVDEGVGPASAGGKATVLVRVPRSHYLRLYREGHGAERPVEDDLAPYVARVSETIRVVVGAVVGPAELSELKIDRVDDLGPSWQPAPASSSAGRAGLPVWLGPALAGLFLGLCIVVVGGRWLLMRGSGGPGARPASRRRLSTLAESKAGPGERVRALVRLDPAAAGGVLHRWIAQGSTDR